MEHRKLLPRPESHGNERSGSSGPQDILAGLIPRRRKAGGRFACDQCRVKKSACDGQRPTCYTCRTRGLQCAYKERDKARPEETSTRLLDLLRNSSENDAIALLHRLRTTEDPASLVAKSLDLNKQANQESRGDRSGSGSEAPNHPLATRATGIELELLIRYPAAYPHLCAVDLDSALFDSLPDHGLKSTDARSPSHGDQYRPPNFPSLARVDFSRWTSVPVDHNLAAGAVSYYLDTDYPIHGLFDADLFLHDLETGDRNFCSPALLNAVLAWACQSYGFVEAAATGYQRAFHDEASRLWEEEEHRNQLTVVAAAHLLSMTAICMGQDDIADQRLREAIDVGCRMGLYGKVEEESAKTWLDHHQDWIRAASSTAWGGYCSATHHYLHYQKPMIERPPMLPIPGELGAELDKSHHESYNSYPMHVDGGRTFNELCKLFRIAHRILWTYYDGKDSPKAPDNPVSRVKPEFAEQIYRELLIWSASLPLELVRTDNSPHHVLLLHAFFHCLVMDIFRPFLELAGSLKLPSFEAGHHEGSILVAYTASKDQLKRLVLCYLSRFHATACSALWRPALIYVLNSLIKDAALSPQLKQSSEWMFFFRLCMSGLVKQLPHYPVTDSVVQGILLMAVRERIMDAAEATRTLDEMRHQAGIEGREAHHVTGTTSFIVDLDRATKDPSRATVNVLVNEFESLTMLAAVAGMVRDQEA